MSETWTQECQECKGSGKLHNKRPDCQFCERYIICKAKEECPLSCPPCSGRGGFNMVVRIVCPNYSRPSTACIHCPAPQATRTRLRELCTTYRPLTVEEVEDFVKRCQLYLKHITLETIIGRMQNGQVFDYKGSPVKLQPREVGLCI